PRGPSGLEILLQRLHGEVAFAVGDDPCHCGDGAGDGGVIGDLAHQRGAADVAAVGDRLGAVGGVDHQLHAAVLHRIHDVRPAFQHLVDLGGADAVLDQVTLRAGGGDD